MVARARKEETIGEPEYHLGKARKRREKKDQQEEMETSVRDCLRKKKAALSSSGNGRRHSFSTLPKHCWHVRRRTTKEEKSVPTRTTTVTLLCSILLCFLFFFPAAVTSQELHQEQGKTGVDTSTLMRRHAHRPLRFLEVDKLSGYIETEDTHLSTRETRLFVLRELYPTEDTS